MSSRITALKGVSDGRREDCDEQRGLEEDENP